MKREDIEKAAGDYSGSILGFTDNKSVMEKHKAFSDGAEWRINSVWHDASEEPQKKGYILVQINNECPIYVTWSINVNPIDWDKTVERTNAVKWAYIEDLLPTKESV